MHPQVLGVNKKFHIVIHGFLDCLFSVDHQIFLDYGSYISELIPSTFCTQ